MVRSLNHHSQSMMRYTHVQTTRTIRNGDSVWSTRILQDGRYDKRWMEQQDSLRLAELSICFVTIRAETQMLVVDGRRVPRVDLDWETRKVLSEQTSIIENIAGSGWHFPHRNDWMSLRMWASLLSLSSLTQQPHDWLDQLTDKLDIYRTMRSL